MKFQEIVSDILSRFESEVAPAKHQVEAVLRRFADVLLDGKGEEVLASLVFRAKKRIQRKNLALKKSAAVRSKKAKTTAKSVKRSIKK